MVVSESVQFKTTASTQPAMKIIWLVAVKLAFVMEKGSMILLQVYLALLAGCCVGRHIIHS